MGWNIRDDETVGRSRAAEPRPDEPRGRSWAHVGLLGCAVLALGAPGPCDGGGGALEPTNDPGFVVTSVGDPSGPLTIASRSSATYTVAVTVTRTSNLGPINATVQLHGTAGVPPLRFDAPLADVTITIPRGAVTGVASLTLTCRSHAPLLPTLAGNLNDSGHGARAIAGPGFIDDPVTVAGTVTSTSPLARGLPVASGSLSVLCL